MKAEDFFQPLENARPFLKLALEGFAGSGKTYTGVQIAIGLHAFIQSDKPIVVYDTERSLKALKPFFDAHGIQVLVRESRSLADLTKAIKLCEDGASDILVIDSITHVWESYVEAYKKEKKRSFIQFQDWGILKPSWKERFSDRLVQSQIHIIFTGRAGYEYENEVNPDTNKREIYKSGIKMKVENETEYEPDIVVLMEKLKKLENNTMTLTRQAQVIKDRTTLIDGKSFLNPTYADFEPAIKILLDGTAKQIEQEETKDEFRTYEEKTIKRKTDKSIALEEIQGILTYVAPSTSGKDKALKLNILEKLFETRSWTKVENLRLDTLNAGVDRLKAFKEAYKQYFGECMESEVDPSPEGILALIPAE